MMNDLSASMEYLQRYNSHKLAAALPEPLLSRYYRQQALQRSFFSNPPPAAKAPQQAHCSTEAAVSEALLTLSSSRPVTESQHQLQQPQPNALTTPRAPAQAPHPANQSVPPSAAVNFTTPPMGLPRRVSTAAGPSASVFETPQPSPSAASATTHHRHHHAKPSLAHEEPAPKKARTVSPLSLPGNDNNANLDYSTKDSSSKAVNANTIHTAESCASCICPVCNMKISGLGGHKVDWSQPVQGRQRAKTITSIKKHVKDHHENEPIWNVIVNSLDMFPGGAKSSSSSSSTDGSNSANNRVVTAHAFVTQALKKAALDQIPSCDTKLRSYRWTEKMMDQRVGIAKGFIQFGGQEYLRNKECIDENGLKINPKGLRNLAYSLLQSMYNDLLDAWVKHQVQIEAAMASASLGLLRNRFQLLFAAPDKWADSWYMDPSKYETNMC